MRQTTGRRGAAPPFIDPRLSEAPGGAAGQATDFTTRPGVREAIQQFFLLFYGILSKGGGVSADPKVLSHFFLS